jgi:thiamine biosynthesis lipoprotein ApbE
MLEVTGIALTVPYLVKMGVTSSEASSLRTSAVSLITTVFSEAERIFSPFVASSELEAKINKARHTDRIPVSSSMADVLALCNDLVEWSEGCFDPTCVPVGRWAVAATKAALRDSGTTSISLQGIEHSSWFPSATLESAGGDADLAKAVQSVVSSAEFTDRRRHTGWRANISIGPDWVQKRSPHTEIDISAVSKGWVVDLLFDRLVQEFSLLDVYVDWGGDIRSIGTRPPDEAHDAVAAPWTAGVLAPPASTSGHGDRASSVSSSASQCSDFVELPSSGASLCTSGDYFQWFHLIDAVMPAPCGATLEVPQSALPASVSLMLAGLPCALCDGLSTALFLMLRRMKHDDVLKTLSRGLPCPTSVGAVVGSLLVSLRLPTGALERVDWTKAVGSAQDLRAAAESPAPPALQRRLSLSTLAGVPRSQERSSLLDASALRHLFRCVPRTVAILLIPMEDGAYYACAVSSLVQTSMMCVTVFVEKNTAAATLVVKAHTSGDIVFGVALVAPEALRRTVQGGTGLLEAVANGLIVPSRGDPLLLDAFHIASYKWAAPPSSLPLVGDHIALSGTWTRDGWSYCRHGAQSSADGLHLGEYIKDGDASSCNLLLRLDKKYITVAPPPNAAAKWKWLPRARCVATVCVGDDSTGRVERCLGTVLTSVDITSRNPLLLTAYAPAGALHDLLFGRAPSSATVTTVRLHVYEHQASGDALVDWFKDVSCVDPAMQFMYHPMPSRTMSNKSSSGVVDSTLWVHEYRFPPTSATSKCIGVVDALVDRVIRPQDHVGYMIVLKPLMCSVDISGEAVCCSYGFL